MDSFVHSGKKSFGPVVVATVALEGLLAVPVGIQTGSVEVAY